MGIDRKVPNVWERLFSAQRERADLTLARRPPSPLAEPRAIPPEGAGIGGGSLRSRSRYLEPSRLSAITCLGNAVLLRLHPTCFRPRRRGIPKTSAARWRSMTSMGAIGIRTWFTSRLRSRTWVPIGAQPIS